MSYKISLLFAVIWALSMILLAAAAQTKPAGEKQYEQLIYSVKGPDLFHANCAACHGLDGKGNGPVAPTLKSRRPCARRRSASSCTAASV